MLKEGKILIWNAVRTVMNFKVFVTTLFKTNELLMPQQKDMLLLFIVSLVSIGNRS